MSPVCVRVGCSACVCMGGCVIVCVCDVHVFAAMCLLVCLYALVCVYLYMCAEIFFGTLNVLWVTSSSVVPEASLPHIPFSSS